MLLKRNSISKLEQDLYSSLNPWYLVEKAKSIIVEKVSRIYNISKEELGRVPVYVSKLPTIVYFEKMGNFIRGFFAKIRGLYNPKRKEIIIDSEELIKAYKSEDGLYQFLKVLAEEFVHRAQDVKGKLRNSYKNFMDYLKNYRKDENEKEAKKYAEEIATESLGCLAPYIYSKKFNLYKQIILPLKYG